MTVPKDFRTEFLETVGNKIPIFHNAPFDLRALQPILPEWVAARLRSRPVWKTQETNYPYHDTLLLSHVFRNTGSHGLKDLCLEYLDIPDDDESDLINAIKKARTVAKALNWKVTPGNEKDTSKGNWLKCDAWVPRELYLQNRAKLPTWKTVLSEYANRDAERTMALFLFLRDVVAQDGLQEVYHQHLQVSPVLTTMMTRGVSLNYASMHSEWDRYSTLRMEAEDKIRDAVGKKDFNVNSPKQMSEFLFGKLGLRPVKFTKKGGASLDKDAIPKLRDSLDDLPLPPEKLEQATIVLDNTLEYRRADKVISYFQQYEDSAVQQGTDHYRIYGSLNQTGTTTTRLSHARPNLGQVGKGKEWEDVDENGDIVAVSDYKTRKAFGPTPGRVWFCLDYKQLQLGIFAYRAGETDLIEGFRRGEDAHGTVARRLYGIPKNKKPTSIQRRDAKAGNFGYIFGKSEWKLNLIQPGLGDLVREIFPHASGYLDATKKELGTQTYTTGRPHVFTKDGYRLYVPPNEKGDDRPYAGVCFEVQGDEGTLVKRAMVLTSNYLDDTFNPAKDWDNKRNLPTAFLCLQVHDELIFDFEYNGSYKAHKKHVVQIRKLMEEAGASLGYETPVSVSVVTDTWDSPVELDW